MKPALITAAAVLSALLALPVSVSSGETNEQALIPLSADDMQRLDIRFAGVTANNSGHGFHLPAVVIHSPESQAQLIPHYSGHLTQWHSSGGTRVEQGDLIAVLSSNDLMQTQEKWLAARHQLASTQAELSKDQKLYDDGIISKHRLDNTLRQQQQAAFNLDSLHRQLLQAGLTDDELKALLNQQRQPGDYYLKAPQTGLLSRSFFVPGDYVPANQTIATVTTDAALWVRAQLNASLANTLQPGDQLGLLETHSTLTLISKNTELTPSSQTVEILAKLNHPAALAPGQQVTLVVASPLTGVSMPAAAVTHSGDITYVYVKHPKGIEARPLQLQALGADYLATSNIQTGEQVVVRGAAQLKGIQLGLGGDE